VRRAAPHHKSIDALVAALLPSIEIQSDRDAFARACGQRAMPRNERTIVVPAAVAAPAQRGPFHRAGSPLLRAADALLESVAHLRGISAPADAAALQAQLKQQLADFEAEATARGVSRGHVDAARGLLCGFVDEVIAATAWGAHERWARQRLQQMHGGVRGAAQDPFDLLQALFEDPVTHAPLIELFYVCIALGFEGRMKNTPHARVRLDTLAARLRTLLPTAPRTLSPHWQGQATRGHRDLAPLPLWVVAALGGVALLALWLALNARLDARTRPVFSRIAALPIELQGTTGRLASRPRLAAALQADMAAGRIEVRDEAQRSVITLPADTLFTAGTARLGPQAGDVLARVAQALRGPAGETLGEVMVIGHGDATAPASLQFPSNWHFTRARAQAVADALAALRVPPARTEGRAEFEPRAPNSTPEERAKNRRIEIELRLPRPDEGAL